MLRANITDAERRKLRLAAARADTSQANYNAVVIRAGLKALNGRGEK